MTDAQALSEARRRWGNDAHVDRLRDAARELTYRVGVRRKSIFDVRGDSKLSFDEAFRDAERRTRL